VAGKLTRRELLKRGALSGAALAVPFIHYRYANAAGGIDPAVVKKFGASLKGRLILPGDREYDSARKLWNLRHDKHPAMIARCADTDDVSRAVEFARKNALVASVRSGGHDSAGYSSNEGGILIDLGSMKAIQVNADRQSVSAQPGLHVHELYDALGEHELAAVSGACPSVGIGGLTTGGGESWISNKYGVAADNVIGAEVVTADSKVVHASASQNSDLFWAIRGGSGNFGVVSTFELRTYPLAKVIKGSLAFPASQCREVLRFCREFAEAAPEELTLGMTYGVPGPADQVIVTVCYCGDPAKGEAVIKPLRSFAKALSDDIRVVPARLGLVDEEPPGLANFEAGVIVPRLSDANIEFISESVKGASPLLTVEIFRFGSAVTRGTGAFPYKFDYYEIDYAGSWREERDRATASRWVDQFAAAFASSSKGAYVNILGSPDQAREAFGQSYNRLAAIKKKYDPDNFFRMNQNIKPAA